MIVIIIIFLMHTRGWEIVRHRNETKDGCIWGQVRQSIGLRDTEGLLPSENVPDFFSIKFR